MSFDATGRKTTDTAKGSKGKKTAKASSETLLEENPSRVEFTVANPSSKTVWLNLSAAAAVKEEGIWLPPNASYTNNSYTGKVTCITTEGEGSITYVEV